MNKATFSEARIYRRRFEIKCPNCGGGHTIVAEDWTGSGMMVCESDRFAACEKPFAYQYAVAWAAKVYRIAPPEAEQP